MPCRRSAAGRRRRNSKRHGGSLHEWDKILQDTFQDASVRVRRDGSGAPWVVQWDEINIVPKNWALVCEVVRLLKRKCHQFAADNREFLDGFFAASREKQSELAAGFEALAGQVDDLAGEIASVLGRSEVCKSAGVKPDQLLQEACPPSKLRWALMKVLALATTEFPVASEVCDQSACAENEGVEDVAICDMLKQGSPIGLFDSIEENNAWPAYKPPPGLRPGEPEELRWAREKLEGEDWASLPIGGASGDMGRQWAELIEKEAQLGRVSEIPFEDAEAFTKVAVIWKKGSRGEVTGVRPIDDFRRSGLNRPIRENLKTTICLPKTQDIQTMLSTAFRGGTGNGLGGSQEAWTLEVDIQSAFRQVPIAMQDRNWLCFFGPPVDDMHQRRRVYRHEVAPFGLVTSPALWCRTAAVAFRVLRRLLAVAETQEGEGPLAISPKFRALLYVDDISMVTCSPRFSLIFMLLVLGLFNMPVALNKVKASRYDGRILGYGVEHGRGKAWLTVPEDKLARVENEVREMVNDPTRKNLRRAMGKLNWLAQVATPVKHSLSVGYELLGVLETKNLRRLNLSEPKRAELLRLVETARSHRRLEIVASGRGVDRYRLHVVCTDASLSGVGGVYVTLPWGTNEQADYLTAGVVPTWFAVNAEEHGSLWTDFKRLRLTAGAVGASTKPEERAGSGNWEFKSGDMVFLEMVAACIGVRLAQVAGSAALTTVYSDNEAVVKILSSQKSRAASLRILMSTVAQSSGGFAAKFIAGERNKVADAISRRPTREIRQSAPKWWMAAETQVVADVVKRLCDECL